MVLTWIGIAVHGRSSCVAWTLYENRRLVTYAMARVSGGTPTARGRGRGVEAGMNGKQIEFPEKQTHVKAFEYAMLAISIICAIIVLVIVLGTDIGVEFRPTL